MSQNGKGSIQRPVDQKKFDENYERIFGKKEPKKESTIEQIANEFDLKLWTHTTSSTDDSLNNCSPYLLPEDDYITNMSDDIEYIRQCICNQLKIPSELLNESDSATIQVLKSREQTFDSEFDWDFCF